MSAASVVTPPTTHTPVRFDRRLAVVGGVVFAANAGLLVLQLVAGRLLSPFVGSSLETWAVVVAAILVGVAVGSAVGGRATAGRPSVWLLVGALSAVWVMLLPIVLNASSLHTALPLGPRIPVLAFLLGFPAGCALGGLTPLVIRIGGAGWVVALAVVGGLTGHVGASTVLLPAFTLNQIVIGTAAGLCVLAAVVSAVRLAPPGEVERRLHPALMPPELPPAPFGLSAAITWSATATAAGVVFGTFVVSASILVPAAVAVLATVAVARWKWARVLCVAGGVAVGGLVVILNTHAPAVETDDAAEPFPLEAVYAAKDAHPDSQRVLVIGGGSTFPARVRETVPTATVEVADNGRVFVTERAGQGVYHVVLLRATADAVPTHVFTKECNEAVKRTLTADGMYLVMVRDTVDGQLWKAVYGTLKESFPHVAATFAKGAFDPEKRERSVIVLCAGNKSIEPDRWAEMMHRQTDRGSGVYVLPADVTAKLLARDTPILLTDQYAPVDRQIGN